MSISNGALCVELSLQGGGILSFQREGQALLAQPLAAPGLASFPMLPFCSRIAQGRLDCSGIRAQLKPNFPPEEHAIHGFGWQRQWHLVRRSATTCTMELHHDASMSKQTGWPWIFMARQHFELTGDALSLSMTLNNLSGSSMPAGMGVHPHFPLDEHTRVNMPCQGRVKMSQGFLPELAMFRDGAWIDPLEHLPWQQGGLDQVYGWGKGLATITWLNQDWSLMIKADSSMPHWIVYAPIDEGFICVEPSSHFPNAINSGSLSQHEGGMRLLTPGEFWTAETIFKTVGTAR